MLEGTSDKSFCIFLSSRWSILAQSSKVHYQACGQFPCGHANHNWTAELFYSKLKSSNQMTFKFISRFALCGLCLLNHALSAAEESAAGIVYEMPPTVFTGTRLDAAPVDQPYAFYRVEMDNPQVGRTALDRMNYAPGVFMQRTAPNQASPFIRGLTGEQTLLLFDGIRLSHAFMRSGPNQYASSVPDTGLSSIDVILGSSSTVNGSDGLTGAMDFRLAPAGRGVTKGFSPWARTRVDTGNGPTFETGIDGASGDWAYSFEVSGSWFHDRKGGQDFEDHLLPGDYDGEIPNTAYDAYSGGLRIGYLGFDDHQLALSTGYKRQVDAPRPGGYAANSKDTSRLYRYFDPQDFSFLHLKHSWDVASDFVDQLATKLWWHQFGEKEFRSSVRDQGTVDERIRQRAYANVIDVLGIDIQATTFLGDEEAHELTWGGTYIHEETGNSYREFRTPKGSTDLSLLTPYEPAEWDGRTTVSDGSVYESLGLFVQDNWSITERLNLLSGIRYSYYTWSFSGLDGSVDDVTGSLRGIWKVDDNHRLFAGISRGFRAPNLTGLDGQTDRGSSGVTVTGDPNLDPEVSYTYEAGWKWQKDRNSLAFTVFRTEIEDLIQTDFSLATPIKTNVEGAQLQGFEAAWDYGAEVGAWQRLALVGSVSLVDATRDIPQAGGGTQEDNLSRANRLYGRVGLKAQKDENWWALLQTRWHDEYDDVANDDSGDVRLTVAGDPDGSMPGYAAVDFLIGWQSDDGNRSVSLYVENIGDTTYREPGSGADGVGRNFGITASVRY
jgi:outer membrane receptor protein involved in Fe transport